MESLVSARPLRIFRRRMIFGLLVPWRRRTGSLLRLLAASLAVVGVVVVVVVFDRVIGGDWLSLGLGGICKAFHTPGTFMVGVWAFITA
jgi:hypothetical protein